MIIRTLVIASVLYFTLFPKKSTWEILKCTINRVALKYDWDRYCITFDIDLLSTVKIYNPNLLGSLVYKSRYELFVVFSEYNKRRIGWTDVNQMFIPGRGSQVVESIGRIENIDIMTGCRILYELGTKNGIVRVMALGIATVKPQIHISYPLEKAAPTFLVGIKCLEDVQISMDRALVTLATNISQNCNYSYELMIYDNEGDKILSLDRKYLYNPI